MPPPRHLPYGKRVSLTIGREATKLQGQSLPLGAPHANSTGSRLVSPLDSASWCWRMAGCPFLFDAAEAPDQHRGRQMTTNSPTMMKPSVLMSAFCISVQNLPVMLSCCESRPSSSTPPMMKATMTDSVVMVML